MAKEIKILKRSEMDPAYCWNTADMFANDEAWYAELEACADLPEKIASYKGRLGESAETLYEYLSFEESIDDRLSSLNIYAFIRLDEDTTNSDYQTMKGRCSNFMVQLGRAGAFAGPEIVAISDETLDKFYAEKPELEKYRRYLTKARLNKPHILSPEEENLMASVSEVSQAAGNIFRTFADADMKFPKVTDKDGKEHNLTNGSYISLVQSEDRVLRENAFKGLYSVYGGFRNTLASMLNAQVRKDIFYSKARKYENSLESALQPVEVPTAVYHNLIEAVHQNMDKLHRYMSLRKKTMGLDELHMYDIYTSMLPDAENEISFEQARDEVLEATKILGEEYHEVLKSSFEQRWMDVYENEGKRSGAYSIGAPVHPYVLLNHKNTLNSEFTLAHEMGHAMHSYLSHKYQPGIYSSYVLFVAEVASTCNEALLMQYLLKRTTDKKQRAVLINYFLEQFRTTLYRQTMFAEFELEISRVAETGEPLTADRMEQIYYDLNKTYYGDDVVVDKEIAIEWARIPHFYRHFYVYQYATGFSAAMALSKRILEGGEEAVKDYLKFLSGGCSTDPVSLLKIAGVDMSTPKPVNDALSLFGDLIDELTELLK